jgi:uncharacterized coiled-coil DUF342 family protein
MVSDGIAGVLGALLGVFGTMYTAKLKHSDHEDVYADHTAELFERLDKITQERDDLKGQVIALQGKVEEQTAQIEALKTQMASLTKAVKGVEKHEQLD